MTIWIRSLELPPSLTDDQDSPLGLPKSSLRTCPSLIRWLGALDLQPNHKASPPEVTPGPPPVPDGNSFVTPASARGNQPSPTTQQPEAKPLVSPPPQACQQLICHASINPRLRLGCTNSDQWPPHCSVVRQKGFSASSEPPLSYHHEAGPFTNTHCHHRTIRYNSNRRQHLQQGAHRGGRADSPIQASTRGNNWATPSSPSRGRLHHQR